jgi:protein-tyrosine-phosphatase/predicted ATP-grasp superfamily ATP-dependent carboligase
VAETDRVLVLDGASRAAVEAVQSLGKRGLEVHVAARADCAAFRSRWTARALTQPSTSDSERFIDWVRTLPDEYSLVIPATGYSLHHLARLPESDPLRALALLPGREALDIALDKARTLDAAVRLGISVPRSSLVPPSSPEAISDLAAAGPLPRVLKPTHSLISTGGDLIEVYPTLVHDDEQRTESADRLGRHCPVLEQELVPGIGIGVECLYARGQMVWHFAHERLHEGTGGGLGSGSFYRKSITAPAELLRAARTLLDDLRWHGVAMVEFKYDRESGRHWLMEINPRLWGSVALAIDAGMDFPYGLYCIATEADPGPQPQYRQPYYTRLVPSDLDWIGRQIRRGGVWQSRELLSLLRLLTGRESWDHFAWTDPGPLLKSSMDFLREIRRALQTRRQARADAQAALRQHAWGLPRLRAQGSARRILFVCTGNICRSPLAAALWQKRHPVMKAESAGFIPREGRRAPRNVQAAARARGACLADHRSRTVDEAMLRESDVIVLFEPRNFVELRRAFPEYLDKIVMLGALLQPPRATIKDPYQLSTAETDPIAAQVDSALAELAILLGVAPDDAVLEPARRPGVPAAGWSPGH